MDNKLSNSEDKLLRYLKIVLIQALKFPLRIPKLISLSKNAISIVKQGEKLRWKKQEHLKIPIPWACIFSVTWRCNLKCKGCYALNFTVKNDLPLEKITSTIIEFNNLGTYFFVIAGGEPLLVEDLLEKLATIKSAFFIFYTNGTLLNSKHLEYCKKAKNILLIVSIEGEECTTDFRRGKGVNQKILEAMKNLKKNRVLFGFSTMVTHENLKVVTSRDWIDKLWQLGAQFGFYIDYIPVEKNLKKSFILTDEDRLYKDKMLKRRNSEARPPIYNLPPDEYQNGECMAAGRGLIHINADGYVEPCPFSHFAADNINEKSITDILNSKFLEEIRQLTESLDNPRKECLLFAHKKQIETVANKTDAKWTEG